MRSAVTRTSPGATAAAPADVPGEAEDPGCAANVAPGWGGGGPLRFVFGKSDSSGGVVALTGGGAVGVGMGIELAVALGLGAGLATGLATGLGVGAGVLAANEANGSASSTHSVAAHVLPAPSAI